MTTMVPTEYNARDATSQIADHEATKYGGNQNEREILFPSGTRFNVTFVEREDDTAVIELEEVTET